MAGVGLQVLKIVHYDTKSQTKTGTNCARFLYNVVYTTKILFPILFFLFSKSHFITKSGSHSIWSVLFQWLRTAAV